MTEKLFYEDSHKMTFSAVVKECRQAGDVYEVVLDRTAFFPEGGGQYADTGMLDGVRVLDVRETGDVIYHIAEGPLDIGAEVEGTIDWEERFSKMQQHTGEHIVSGIVNRRFGYRNVGFHLASDYCTMDFEGEISREELREVEWEANNAVAANLPVQVSYPTKDMLYAMEYRSKIDIEGQVRIVTIPGYDVCACCAPHVNQTGEIGLIKLVQMQNYKGGVRVTMLCGFRALRDYSKKEESVKGISAALSAKADDVVQAVERLKEENALLKGRAADLQRQILGYKVKGIPEGERVVCLFEPDLTADAPRELVNLVLESGKGFCAVFAGNEKEGYRYVIGSKCMDVRELCKVLNGKFNGRGGGKPEMVQGSLMGEEEKLRETVLSECGSLL